MYTKVMLTVFTFVCVLPCIAGKLQAAAIEKSTAVFPDSIPSITTIAAEDIDTVRERRKTNTIDVKLKNGVVYSYDAGKLRAQWENKPGLPVKIETVINDWRKTFTKVEHPAEFPGGGQAWDAYVKKYIEENKASLEDKGTGQVYLQFIVDTNGELSGIEVFKSENAKLSAIAIDALEKSPFWLPAVQNGHKVVAYQKVTVKF